MGASGNVRPIAVDALLLSGDPASIDADEDDPDVNIRTAMTLLQQKLTVAAPVADAAAVRAEQLGTPALRRMEPPAIDRLTPSSKPGIARTIVSPRGPVSPTSAASRLPRRALVYARALFDYKPSRSDILALKRGYVVAVYQRVTADWWKGAFRDRVGLLPSNYLQTLAPIGTVTALLDFSGRHKRHLTFAKGDTIFVVKEGELGWLEGFLPFSGAFGRFPGSYVSHTVALPADGSLLPVVHDPHDADSANSGGAATTASSGGATSGGSRRRARYEASATGGANGVSASERRARHASMPAVRASTPTERRNAAALCDKCRNPGVAGRVLYGKQSLMLCAACLDLLQRMATDTDDTELDATELDAKVEPSTLPPLPPLPHNESSTEIDSVRRDVLGSDESTSDNSEDDAFRTRQLARRQQATPTQPSPHVATGGLTLRMRELHELEAQIDAKARIVAQMEREANEKLALAQAKAVVAAAAATTATATTATASAVARAAPAQAPPPLPSESASARPPPPLPLERVTVASREDREAKLAADLLRELERFSAPEPTAADAGPVQLSLADFLLPGDAIDDEQALRADELLDRHEREALGDDDDDADEATQTRANDRAAAASNDGEDDNDDDADESSDGEGARDDSDLEKRAPPPKPTTAPSASPPGAPPGEPAYSDEQMALLRITQDVDFLFLSAETDDVVRYGAPPANSGLRADSVELMALATLPKLIERLTDSGEPDARLALHLLSTYSVFSFSTPSLPRAQCTPQMLFRLLKMRYFLGSLTADVGAELSRAGQQAVAVLCRLWTLHAPTDFLDDGALLAEIDHFVHEDIPSTGGPSAARAGRRDRDAAARHRHAARRVSEPRRARRAGGAAHHHQNDVGRAGGAAADAD
jgi:hypothetical protein